MSDTPETDELCKRLEPLLEGLTIKNAQESLTQITRETLFHSERLERERDEAKGNLEAWRFHAAAWGTDPDEVRKYIKRLEADRDDLRAEVERLKTTVETLASHFKSSCASRNAHAVNFRKSEVKRIEAEREVERLKADAELYSGWSKWKDGIWRISHPDSGPSAEWVAEALQSAMKGAE